MTDNNEFEDYTVSSLAAISGFTEQYIRRLIRDGVIKGRRPKPWRWWVIKRSDGDSWLRSIGKEPNNI